MRSRRAPTGRGRCIESAVTQLEHDISALRAIITDLRPAALDELGLEPALRTLVAGVAKAAGLEARVSIKLGAVRLDADLETIAYRVAQEALTNVVKHADARTVAVELILDAERLRLIVADDGRGFGERTMRGTASSGCASAPRLPPACSRSRRPLTAGLG